MTALFTAVVAVAVSLPSASAFVVPTSKSKGGVVPVSTATTSSSSASTCTKTTPTFSSQSSISRRKHSTYSVHAASSTSSELLTPTSNDTCDVLVLGSGPAARAIATLLASPVDSTNGDKSSSPDIVLADANYDSRWFPNYGVWQDEWESIRTMFSSYRQPLGNACIERTWEVTDCFFGGSFDIPAQERMRLDRPYCRVDRDALRRTLSPKAEVEVVNAGEEGKANYRVIRANHISRATSINVYSPSGSILHDEFGSTILLQSKKGDITQVRAKLIVDCTGHETSIVVKDDRCKSIPPGFQIAYGFLVKVDESTMPDATFVGPYYKEAMTLFDYRTDHFPENSDELYKATKAPTFMYAMPLESNRIFFEETSLVARPALSFAECKERCMTRLKYLGITVLDVEEEEYCYIPMGGPLPAKDQRVVAFGGAAAMVHPSTGYHLCRAMMGAGNVAKAIREELRTGASWNPDRAAARAYDAIWSPSNIAQRNFAVFGGEFLMKQNVVGLRGFFDGFFKLPLPLWGGFLAGWPGLPNNDKHETWWARLVYGLTFV